LRLCFPTGQATCNGTAVQAGASGAGVVFQLTPGGAQKTLYSFAGHPTDGRSPYGALISDASGNLYGTTAYGDTGTCLKFCTDGSCGTIFKVGPTGVELVLHNFTGGSDGANFLRGVLLEFYRRGLYKSPPTSIQITESPTDPLRNSLDERLSLPSCVH
jgi:uncharacterized repeat protein (TIGR03803 family)